MESDDTQLRVSEPLGEAQTLASGPEARPEPSPAADEPQLQSRFDDADLDVRHRKAMVMASLFDEDPEPVEADPVAIALREAVDRIDPDSLTPRQALDAIYALVDLAHTPQS